MKAPPPFPLQQLEEVMSDIKSQMKQGMPSATESRVSYFVICYVTGIQLFYAEC